MPLPLAALAIAGIGGAIFGGAQIYSTVKSTQMQQQAMEQNAKSNEQMMALLQQQQQQGQQNLPVLLSMLQQGNQNSAYLSQFTGFQMPQVYGQLPQLLADQSGIQLPAAGAAPGAAPGAGGQQPVACNCGGHGPAPAQAGARPPG